MTNTLIIDLEGGYRYLDVPADQVREPATFAELDDLLTKVLAAPADKQPARVVIDPVDKVYELAERHTADEHGVLAAGQVEFGKATTVVDARYKRVLSPVLSSQIGLILVSHAEQAESPSGQTQLMPTVHRRVRPWTLGAMDVIALLVIAGRDRALLTQPAATHTAKSRIALPDPATPAQLAEAMPARMRALIYGEPGVGKSTLAAHLTTTTKENK
jgi:hypothetical protein